MTDFPDLKLKAMVSYPANIIGGTGLTATKSNGSIVLDFAWQEFGAINAIPTSPTSYVLTYDTVTNAYVMVPSHLLGGGVSGIADAPNDGTLYGRQNAGWINIPGATPANAPPNMDGIATIGTSLLYARQDHIHPSDTTRLGEAPTDGFSYGRASGAWSKVLPLSGGTLTGALTLNADPTTALGAATKQYVDAHTASAGFDSIAPTTTRGDLIYRNATTNTRLGAGTVGYLLQTNGAGADPSWMGFSQNAAGATTRTWQAKAAERVSILDFGGGPGVADNSPALNAALAYSNCVYIPPGTYTFNSTVIYTYPNNTASLTLTGAGQDMTILNFPTTAGLQFNFITDQNSLHLRDMTLTTGQAGAATGIYLQQNATGAEFAINLAQSDITSVTLRGNDGYQKVNYWINGIEVFGISNVNFISVMIAGRSSYGGNGINILGTSDQTRIPAGFNFFGCEFSGLSVGLIYGAYTQGVVVLGSNFTNCQKGIYAPGGTTGLLDQLTVNSSQFNCQQQNIWLEATVLDVMISNNLMLQGPGSYGIVVTAASSTVISGNTFAGDDANEPGTTGIHIIGWSSYASVITGNNFREITTGVWNDTGSKNVNVQSNGYSRVSNMIFPGVPASGSGNTQGSGSW